MRSPIPTTASRTLMAAVISCLWLLGCANPDRRSTVPERVIDDVENEIEGAGESAERLADDVEEAARDVVGDEGQGEHDGDDDDSDECDDEPEPSADEAGPASATVLATPRRRGRA